MQSEPGARVELICFGDTLRMTMVRKLPAVRNAI
jgi:hypothetical protein